jgi:hypothetical protein
LNFVLLSVKVIFEVVSGTLLKQTKIFIYYAFIFAAKVFKKCSIGNGKQSPRKITRITSPLP